MPKPYYFRRGLVVDRRHNLYIEGSNIVSLHGTLPKTWSMRKHFQIQQVLGMVILTALYGGAHLAVWSYAFPSEAEKWLWRISAHSLVGLPALIILGVPVIWVMKLMLVKAEKRRQAGRHAMLLRYFACAWGLINLVFILTPLGCLVVVMYFGRIFILVEAFVSLRAPPDGTYAAIGWTKNLPHFE